MKIGSLFSGIGGIDIGFLQAGFTVAWANDCDPQACKTYRFNFPNVKLYEMDICRYNPTEQDHVDVITAGFPCQPFSICGSQNGFSDKRGLLFFEIMRIADTLNHPILFLENVANITDHNDGKTFNIIHNELSERGYFIRYAIMDACQYGIPQHRTRMYLIAFKNERDCNAFLFPLGQDCEKNIFDCIDRMHKQDEKFYIKEGSATYMQLISAMKDPAQIYRFSDFGVQSGKNGISFTLKANMGTWRNRIPYIRDDYGIRMITPQECLALQGFPENFVFPSIPIASAYKQCGNTVAVPVIKAIAKEMLNTCM